MVIKIYLHLDGDPELPEGDRSIFENMDLALDLEEMQADRMASGCLEAHIELYYDLHQQRLVDHWNEESYRFMNGECQECGSTEGYQESDERCSTHRKSTAVQTPV